MIMFISSSLENLAIDVSVDVSPVERKNIGNTSPVGTSS